MVKQLLFLAAAAFCAPAFAQQESAFVDAETSVGALVAETELCKSASVTMSVPFAETYKKASLTAETDSVEAISIDGKAYDLTVAGIVGTNNAKQVDCKQLPASGSVFRFKVKADGYLYVIAKLNGNKQIYVANENDGYVVAYTVSAFGANGDNFTYTLPVNEEAGPDVFKMLDTESTFTEAQAPYVASNKIATPAVCFKASNPDATVEWGSSNASGCVAFPVQAGKNYYFYCAGSKPACSGFVFIPGATKVATIEAAGKPASAIKDITLDDLGSDAPVYNLQGQRVAKNYKGVCIQNGKKFVVK